MASFAITTITRQGIDALSKITAGQTLVFTKVEIGDGSLSTSDTSSLMTSLRHTISTLDIDNVWSPDVGIATVRSYFSNEFITKGFYYRELGLFATHPTTGQEILYAYANAGTDAEYIPATGTATTIEKIINIDTIIGNASSVSASFESSVYVTATELNNHITDPQAHEYLYKPVTFYVAKTGNDTTGTGAEDNPFLTVQHAIDSASTYALSVTVIISSGAYDEDVTATNKQWRYLSIKRKDASQTVSIKSAFFTRINFVTLTNLTFTGKIASLNDAIRLDYCQSYINACTFTAPDADSFGVYAYGARTKIFDSVFNNWKTAIFCNNGILESYNNSGSGCVTAYGTSGGIISVSTTDNIGATTPRTAIQGGAIIDETTGKAITAGKLAQTHVDNNFSLIQKQNNKYSVLSVNSVNADSAGNVKIDATITGTVIAYAGNSTPAGGYLICNGATVSRTTYSALFSAIGTIYGAGDGSTTFKLPNLTDKFIQGSETAGTVKDAGLPNITGTHWTDMEGTNNISGAFYKVSATSPGGDNDSAGAILGFDASLSNAIYGASTTVQPPAVTMRYYIKY